MKFLTTFIFLFPVLLFGQIDLPQGCVTVQDSTFITKGKNPNKQAFGTKDSIYFLTRAYICEDGRDGSPRAPIGDSAIVFNNLKRNAIDLSRQWAAAITIAAMKNEAVIAPVRAMNRTTISLFNQNLFSGIAAEFPDSMFVADYKFTNEAGVTVDANITKNNQGVFRLRWGSNSKIINIVSDVHIRVLNYAGTKDMDLIRRNSTTARWVSDTPGIILVNTKLRALQQSAAK